KRLRHWEQLERGCGVHEQIDRLRWPRSLPEQLAFQLGRALGARKTVGLRHPRLIAEANDFGKAIP
ncbi:hypothetical protein, partial [Klebsiella pneumoniae]|uniref:hypothetical protein n=1 Tax=Klebsiella pneumoniae TaxID=573 RepID=UPI003CF2B739